MLMSVTVLQTASIVNSNRPAEARSSVADGRHLGSKEIDVIATQVQFAPAAQAAAVELLHGLSAAVQKSILDFTATVQSLSATDREAMSSSLEKSGVVNAMNLLIPLLEMGDALDPGFLAHEISKSLYASANILSWLASILPNSIIPPLGPPNKIITFIAIGVEGTALGFDIASQYAVDDAADKDEAKIALMEEAVGRIEQKINYIMDLPEGAAIPTTPPDTKPVSLTILEKMLEVTKKFYKFEGCFTPTFAKDKQLIRIGPLATDPTPTPPIPLLVTGFIDLSGMQHHDVVTITTKVLEPPCPAVAGGTRGPARYVIWRVKTYADQQSSGMKHFQDFADLLEVPGDGVELLIAQGASAHNFDTAVLLTIPYQFLVESTILPQFSLS